MRLHHDFDRVVLGENPKAKAHGLRRAVPLCGDKDMSWQDWALLFVAAANVFAVAQRFLQWREQRKHRREK